MNEPETLTLSPAESSGIARAAAVIALGNVVGRVLGLGRETVKSYLFGAAVGVDVFQVASVVPNQLYNLLVGGMVTGGLVPVLSDYADESQQDDLWRLFSTLVTLAGIILAGLVALAVWAAPLVAWLLGRGFDPQARQLTVLMLRVTLPSVFFLCMSGILTGLLYALKRFSLPAFTSSAFNASIVIAALLAGPRLGVMSMAVGILVGSILQVVLQLPALHNLRPRWLLDWRHPGLRRLARLYGPVAGSLVIDQAAIYLSVGLASLAGEGSLAWMNYATTLIQFPLGLVVTAISMAILPTLSRQASLAAELASPRGDSAPHGEFMATLAHGLKLVLLLIIPAAAGLFVLARPIVGVLFEHGQFSPADTLMTASVLRFYLPGLIFAAIDLPLVYAFYARKDTLTPALVGLACILIYLAAALLPTLFHPLHVTDLALANSVQLTSHALIMLVLLRRRIGRLQGDVLRLAVKAAGCAALMGGGALWVANLLEAMLGGAGLLGELLVVLGSGGVGVIIYLGLMRLLRVPELEAMWRHFGDAI
ncbi:MAG: murein biosynthesis integral membrane protein MurJ [Thermoflexales bacterium]|nr:murein biosynthesis integral membrane protein MurJ [Thermoflexales bacterium]